VKALGLGVPEIFIFKILRDNGVTIDKRY